MAGAGEGIVPGCSDRSNSQASGSEKSTGTIQGPARAHHPKAPSSEEDVGHGEGYSFS